MSKYTAILMSRNIKLCALFLCSLIVTWTVFVYLKKDPAQGENVIYEAAVKQAMMGPFLTDRYTSYGPVDMPGMRLLSREQDHGLAKGMYALYLSDYANDEEALSEWENYRQSSVYLKFFSAFVVDNKNTESEKSRSMIALLRRFDLSEGDVQDLLDDICGTLQEEGRICSPLKFSLNLDQTHSEIIAVAKQRKEIVASWKTSWLEDSNDPVLAHERQRRKRQLDLAKSRLGEDFEQSDLFDTGLNALEPAAGFYNPLDRTSVSSNYDQEQPTFENGSEDDTVTQAAMRAAFEMVRNRYENVIYQAKMNDGTADISEDDVVALTQDAIKSAAERAFESFVRENFNKRDFKNRDYEGLRGYFMNAFKHAAKASIQSVGKRFVRDITETGNFKSLAIRSQILQGVDAEIAKAFIDTGLAAAKNSQYAFLRNLEVSYKLREHTKPEFNILTLQPIYSSDERRHNIFVQAALSHQGNRIGYTGGLGYRYMPSSEDYVVGTNVFFDYERPYSHLRTGFGLDVQTSLWGAAANMYKGLSGWTSTTGYYQERPMDGFDIELTGRMPFLPAMEVSARGYRWQGFEGVEDIDGSEFRVEYSPIPAFTLEGLVNDEGGRETEYGFGLRYNHTFGAPPEYMFDWDEQFRKKSASEYIFSKVRRENTIRVQERIDEEAVAADIVLAALLASTPTDGSAGQSVGINVSFTFDQDVQAGAGNIVFTDTTDGSDTFNIPVGDARVSIVNDTVTIDLSAQLLEFLTNYEVTFASGVFEDLSGNPTEPLGAGDLDFTTVVDPTAGFPAVTVSVAPNTTVANFEDAQDVGSWQTTINIGGAPDGVIFESGATGQGIAASFGGGNLVFAGGDGASTATNVDSIFGTYPIASIPQGLHHFVFVADPDAPAEIGVYIDGIRVVTETIAGSMQSGEWAGTNGAGYGLLNSAIRAGVNAAPLTGATLTNNLSFWTGVAPASF